MACSMSVRAASGCAVLQFHQSETKYGHGVQSGASANTCWYRRRASGRSPARCCSRRQFQQSIGGHAALIGRLSAHRKAVGPLVRLCADAERGSESRNCFGGLNRVSLKDHVR